MPDRARVAARLTRIVRAGGKASASRGARAWGRMLGQSKHSNGSRAVSCRSPRGRTETGTPSSWRRGRYRRMRPAHRGSRCAREPGTASLGPASHAQDDGGRCRHRPPRSSGYSACPKAGVSSLGGSGRFPNLAVRSLAFSGHPSRHECLGGPPSGIAGILLSRLRPFANPLPEGAGSTGRSGKWDRLDLRLASRFFLARPAEQQLAPLPGWCRRWI